MQGGARPVEVDVVGRATESSRSPQPSGSQILIIENTGPGSRGNTRCLLATTSFAEVVRPHSLFTSP